MFKMDGLMINHVLHYVTNLSDFLDLVREYMGEDAYKYLYEFKEDYKTMRKILIDDGWDDTWKEVE